MAFKENPNLNYEYDEKAFNRVIDEKGNQAIIMRKVRWRENADFKLDIRKYLYTDEGEQFRKGISFLTDEGPGELAKALLEEGYGGDEDIATSLYSHRPEICNNIMDLMNGVKLKPNKPEYDPEDIFKEDLYEHIG